MKQWEKDEEYVKSCIGWMSPCGEIVSCESWEHMDKAEEILNHMNIMEKEYKSRPDDYLWNLGWIKISIMQFFGHGLHFSIYRMASEEQKKKMREIYDRVPGYIDKSAGLELQAQGVVTRQDLIERGFKYC